jgi:outer membrane protein assembly factor BamA
MVFLGASISPKPTSFYSRNIQPLLIGVLSLVLIDSSCLAQTNDSTQIKSVVIKFDDLNARFAKHYHNQVFLFKKWPDVKQELDQDLLGKGYLTPKFLYDTVGSSLELFVSIGTQYKWLALTIDEGDKQLLRASGIRINRVNGDAIAKGLFENLLEKPIKQLENHGFPFAKIALDSIMLDSGKVSANLKIDKGPIVIVDSVLIRGDVALRKAFVTNYLGIKEGSLYDEAAVKAISRKLADLTFLQESQTAKVYFDEEETKIVLSLKQVKSSRFDGIIGFLPDQNTGDLLITGDAQIHLENALKQGEEIEVNWRKLQTNTQQFDAGLVTPFVLNSPVSLDFSGSLYRRDTTFNEVQGEFGVRYVISQNNYFRAFVGRKSTSLLSTNQYSSNISPPEYLDRNILNYGLGLSFNRLDYRLNPANGYNVKFNAAFGNRTIVKNSQLPEVVYEKLTLNSLQLSGDLDASYYLSFIKRLVWHQQLIASSLINDQLFNNDAARIGGLKTLRGFDEQQIFATTFALLRNEVRYQYEKDGYAFLFFDGAWYENRSEDPVGAKRDTPYGFGAGFSFATRAGVFSISYALGSQLDNPILLRGNKIHFGFVSIF